MAEAPSETALQFAAVAEMVPGIGTALAAVVGFISSFRGDPQTLNPFRGPEPFAGGMYDPPNVWRAGKPGCAFQGLLWGYPPSQWDVNEHYRRRRGGELHSSFVDKRTVAQQFQTDTNALHIKGLYETTMIDVDLVPKRVARVKAQWHNPPTLPTFFYLKPEGWFDFLHRRHDKLTAELLALFPGIKTAAGQTSLLKSRGLLPFDAWASVNGPLLAPTFKMKRAQVQADASAEADDWRAFRAAMLAEQQKLAFLAASAEVAKAAAVAAYNAALAAAQSGHVQPPAPATVPPHLVPNPSTADTSSAFLNLGLTDQAQKPEAQAVAVAGAGLLLLLLL